MAIETFLIEEAEKLIAEPEQIEEWTKTVEELGLKGQQELVKPEKSPIPFQPMNRRMQRVYQTLCPARIEVAKYNKSTIPLRVLSLIALAQKEEYFKEIEIWYDDKEPDPIAVGLTKSRYDDDGMFILARWGDELKDFPTLLNEAKERWKKTISETWVKEKAKFESFLANPDAAANGFFDALRSKYDYE